MKKLKDLLNESVEMGRVYSNPFATAFVKESEEPTNDKTEMTEEQKQAFYEAVKQYRRYGEAVYRNAGLSEVYEAIKNMVEVAGKVTLSETGDWFDNVTVGRHMKRMGESFRVFEKTLKEVSTLQQRLEASYDEIGEVLGKYYEISELNEIEEGNEFGSARAKAIANGDSEFEVDGKTYKVTNVDKEDKENAEKFANELDESKFPDVKQLYQDHKIKWIDKPFDYYDDGNVIKKGAKGRIIAPNNSFKGSYLIGMVGSKGKEVKFYAIVNKSFKLDEPLRGSTNESMKLTDMIKKPSITESNTEYLHIIQNGNNVEYLHSKHDNPNLGGQLYPEKHAKRMMKRPNINVLNWSGTHGKYVRESVNEAKYDIGMARKGNGLTIYNKAEEEKGDYKNIAFIDNKGNVKLLDKKLPKDVLSKIDDEANKMKESINEAKKVTRIKGFNKESDGYILMLDLLKNDSKFKNIVSNVAIDLYSGGKRANAFKVLVDKLTKVLTPDIVGDVVIKLGLELADSDDIRAGKYNRNFAGILSLGLLDSLLETPLDTELIKDLKNSKLTKLANEFSANRGRKKFTTYVGRNESINEANKMKESVNEGKEMIKLKDLLKESIGIGELPSSKLMKMKVPAKDMLKSVNEAKYIDKLSGKELAKRMLKNKIFKPFAKQFAKMKIVTHDDLQNTLPDWVPGKEIQMLFSESVNEARLKKVTKQMWAKMNDEQRVNALLTFFKDPNDAEEYFDSEWNDLPSGADGGMYIFE